MFLRIDAARSDFFLVSAIILFGSLLTSLVAGLIPIDSVSFWLGHLLQPLLLVITPIWLQRTRHQPLRDLIRGSWKDALFGVVIALPVVLAVVAIQAGTGGVGLYFGNGLLFPALAKWLSLGFALGFLVQRAELAFPGDPAPANDVTLRIAGVLIGLGVLAGLGFATLALVTKGDGLSGALSEITLALLPLGAGLAWVLGERVTGLSGNVNRSAWYTVAVIMVLAEVNILGIIGDFAGFAFDLMMLAPLGALALVSLAGWHAHKSVWFGYAMAIVYAFSSVPGQTVFF